jgi:mannose-6-phosphate isomerase-like protein (cupin superfamily)
MTEQVTTPVHVVQPNEGESFWQPVPANGYAEVRVSHRKDPSIRSFATGIQVIAPSSYIREHVHPAQEELLFFFEGEGEAVIDGASHPLRAGTTVYVGAGHRHKFVNTSAEHELKMCWMMLPGGDGGLDDFFARIGRPRTPGEPAPSPFPRPADVERIEAETVFTRLDQQPASGYLSGGAGLRSRSTALTSAPKISVTALA